ncbi:MAG: ABC transporter permease [Thermomicrobiales bacterium]
MSSATTTSQEAPQVQLADQSEARKQRSLWLDAWRRLLRNKAAILALAFISLEVVIALAAPLIAPYGYTERNPLDNNATTLTPSSRHLLGSDSQGRDVLSRVIYGSRVSLTVGFVAEFIILAIGVPLGLLAGFYGRWVDTLLMRFVDVMYAFPDLLFMIILIVFLKAKVPAIRSSEIGGVVGILLALAFTSWLTLSRLVRGEVLSLKRREFVEAAEAIGATNKRVMFMHLLPNVLPPIIISATIGIPAAILAEAGLSFIGIGINPPTPSWGQMIAEGLSGLRSVPHIVLAPATALALTVLAFNFLGDGLRDALDPRMKS